MVSDVWILPWVLRLMWTAWPQTGYIHPDEFFQSVEVVSGDMLNLTVHRSWEFNKNFPIRSIVLPYMVCAPGCWLLQTLGWENDANALLVFPRVTVTLLSFINDILVYKIAGMLHLNQQAVMLTYTTSYVTMVYHTRTLSNTLEAFLFTALVYFVVRSVSEAHSTRQVKPRSKLSTINRTSRIPLEDQKIAPYFLPIAIVLAFGFFNRPTFLLYAHVPLMYWLVDGSLEAFKDFLHRAKMMSRFLVTITATLFMSWIIVFIDSAYYKDFKFNLATDTFYDFISASDQFLTITPWNFIEYNRNPDNLAEHTLHPRFLHLLINAPLLFCFMALFAVRSFVESVPEVYYKIKSFRNLGHHLQFIPWKSFLIYSYMLPLLLISIFPHQEPRFIIPLLLPLALLYGHHIFGMISSQKLTVSWIVFNVLCSVFYGALHQGSLIYAISSAKSQYLKHVAQDAVMSGGKPERFEHHVLFYNTYMPPRHLFLMEEGDRLPMFYVHDLKGSDPEKMLELVKRIDYYASRLHSILLVAPRTSEHKFCHMGGEGGMLPVTKLKIRLLYQFPWHISTENMPTSEELGQVITGGLKCSQCSDEDIDICNDSFFWNRLNSLFALNLYQVTLEY